MTLKLEPGILRGVMLENLGNQKRSGQAERARWATACLLLLCAAQPLSSLAQETPTIRDGQQESSSNEPIAARTPEGETGSESDHLTGDWGGLRSRLVEKGIHFQAGYTAEVMANISGGIQRGAVYDGLLELGLELDTEKLGGWKGGVFRVTSLWTHGPSLSRNFTGDLLTGSNIDAYDSLRLYDFWFEQKIGEKFSARFGQLRADDEFTGTELGEVFLNAGFGWPAFISGNTVNTGPAFFAAAPGLRLRYDFSPAWYLQGGVYDGDSFDSPAGDPRVNRSGTRLHVSAEQGSFSMAELGWRLNAGEGAAGLPGTVKLGGWLHTGSFSDNYRDNLGRSLARSGAPALEHGNNFGVYAAAGKMVWREGGAVKKGEEQGLGLFCRAGGSPADRSFFELVADGGASYTGLIPGRESDILAVGFVHARLSRDLRRQQEEDRDFNGVYYPGLADHETVLEAVYELKLKPWWIVRPDIQWILHPGGSRAIPNALVVGLRTSIVF